MKLFGGHMNIGFTRTRLGTNTSETNLQHTYIIHNYIYLKSFVLIAFHLLGLYFELLAITFSGPGFSLALSARRASETLLEKRDSIQARAKSP